MLGLGPVAVLALYALATLVLHPGGDRVTALVALMTLLSLASLLFRRRSPSGVLAFALLASLISDGGGAVVLAVLLALLAVVILCEDVSIVLGALATVTVLLLTPWIHGHPMTTAPPVVSRLVAVGLAVALGLYLRARAQYITGLQDRATRLERERELLATQAVADERVRIARELHDVVAHNVSLMVVQAQALAATHGGDPAQLAALDRIAGTGRDALSEMHRMLGVLRVNGSTGAELEPQPGVRDLASFVERAHDAGISAELTIEGSERPLPTGVDLSAYRIAQEALTNVIRHAHAEHATIRLTYAPNALELTILDDGAARDHAAPTAVNGNASGHGLVGMRERVALFGGELEAGPRPDTHGYRVRACLPLS
jgi:signal transduction histidine kinase